MLVFADVFLKGLFDVDGQLLVRMRGLHRLVTEGVLFILAASISSIVSRFQ